MSVPIRVVVADGHCLLREGLARLLGDLPDIRVVGLAADGVETVRMAEALQPDIVLLDTQMPDADGLKILAKLLERSPKTKILIVSGDLADDLLIEALEQGARGYIEKTSTHTDLVKAVRATHAGEIWARRKALTQLVESLLRQVNGHSGSTAALRSTLTEREKEIVQYVVQGLTNKEVALKVDVSEKTIKTHLSNIFRKLNISRRVELLVYRSIAPTN